MPASLLMALAAWVLRNTALGLALRAVGAEPRAVDKSGLSVTRVRYGAVLFTGVMSALGGCFLSIGDIHTFTEGMTNGAGYLAIGGGDLRQLEDRPHAAGVPVLRRRDGAAVPAAGDGHRTCRPRC